MTPAAPSSDQDHDVVGTAHFRCRCGRSVATPHGSLADDEQRCSRCRRRAQADEVLRRTDEIVTRS